MILTKVAISGTDVIGRGPAISTYKIQPASFCISHHRPSSSPLFSFSFSFFPSSSFSHSHSRKPRLHLAGIHPLYLVGSLLVRSLSYLFRLLLLSSASLPLLPLPPPSSINLFFSLRSSGPRNEQRKSIGWHCGFVPSPVVLRFSLILASAPVVPLMPRSPSRENSISFFFCPTPFLFYKRKKRFVLIDEVTLSSFYPYFCFTAKDFIVISAYSLFRENSRAGSGPRNLFFSFFYDKEELGFLAIDELTLQFVFSKFSLRYLIDGDGNLVTSIKRRIYINIHSKITVYNKFGMTRESRAKSRFTTIGNFTPDSLLMNRKGEQEKGA